MIKILSNDVVSKIAAGEVVEHPRSIVKELVENSIDAGATFIEIELVDGGISSIIVRDNGSGMDSSDALLSFLPHSTSKIETAEDLFKLSSFGFRGEALSSIAAVSALTISSREKNSNVGIRLSIKGGELLEEEKVGIPEGTEIKVESLFYNTPARAKFLGDAATEVRACLEIISRIALAYPTIGFSVVSNGTRMLHLPENQSYEERIADIFNEEFSSQLIPIIHENTYGKISGFIGIPQSANHQARNQYLFVNNRSIKDRRISEIMKQSFGSLIEARAHPSFIIYITVPREQLDINIHPRKEEVAFAFAEKIYNLITESVQNSLKSHDLTYRKNSFEQDTSMDWNLATLLKHQTEPWSLKSNLNSGDILQINNLYLALEVEGGMMLVDQHAAHERILFEQFSEQFLHHQEKSTSIELEKPYLITLTPQESVSLEKNLLAFLKLGFELEKFGNNSYKLSSIPDYYQSRDYMKLIQEVLYDIEHDSQSRFTNSFERNSNYIDRETERTLAYLACRSAIKAGEPLTQDERKNLINKLLDSKTSYTCPHGRPTHILIAHAELGRMFKRI